MIERIITVEYLEPSMSRELLCKFPDNSAYDFDYSQSGIWSPLVPRGQCLITISPTKIKRKLSYGLEKMAQEKIKKASSKIKTKMATFKKSSDLSATPAKGSTPKKGWTKMLGAASKGFKKKKVSSLDKVKLSNYFRNRLL